MDTNEKLATITDMVKNPERYSEQQKDELLKDEECHALYEQLVESRRATDFAKSDKAIMMPDIDDEWSIFKNKNIEQKRKANWRNIVAACIAVLLISGLSYAAIRIVNRGNMYDRSDATVKSNNAKITNDSIRISTANADTTSMTSFIFNNVELEKVMYEVAEYYHVQICYRTEKTKHIRLYLQWDKNKSLDDVIDMINHFDKVKIAKKDNTLYIN